MKSKKEIIELYCMDDAQELKGTKYYILAFLHWLHMDEQEFIQTIKSEIGVTLIPIIKNRYQVTV